MRELIKKAAEEYGASLCGIGDVSYFAGDDPQHNPLSILPDAKSIISFGFTVPKGLYKTMNSKAQYYNYTNLGVKYIDEGFAVTFLLKMARIIEDNGYDACVQRSVPGFRVKGDKSVNPEVNRTFELKFSSPVKEGLPPPDVIIDYNKAAMVCGLGSPGLHSKIITPKYGPFVRFVFIITDMPLKCDEPFEKDLCDKCGECIRACPGNAVSGSGVDTVQCSVYYRGAHKSNPFMTEDFLRGNPERELIINGKKRFTKEEAEKICREMKFLPNTHFGYVPCLCGKACEVACYRHFKGADSI